MELGSYPAVARKCIELNHVDTDLNYGIYYCVVLTWESHNIATRKKVDVFIKHYIGHNKYKYQYVVL